MADLGRPASIRDEIKSWRSSTTWGTRLGEGGSGRRTRRRARVPGSGAAYGLRQLAQKEQGMEEELTKVL
jgi:hypothetical protein